MRYCLLVLALAGCSSPSPVKDAQGRYPVEIDLVTASAIARNASYKAKLLLPDLPKQAEPVTLAFYTTGTGRLGDQNDIALYSLTFDGGEIASAKFENLNDQQITNLAVSGEILSNEGRQSVSEFCLDPKNAGWHSHFCKLLLP